jgi:RNA polymerase sigma-70 factor (ECF subfamily)
VTTEEQLIASAKKGSAGAFSELVERYQESLFRFLLVRCKSHADAEDAIQDTFINAYRYIGSYNPRWKFSTWLFRISLRNVAKMSNIVETTTDELVSNFDDPLEACIADSERENLWLAARRLLTADAYTAMWLRHVEDMSIKEISHTLERTMSWTKVTLMRGRQRLSAELAGAEDSTANGEVYGQT